MTAVLDISHPKQSVITDQSLLADAATQAAEAARVTWREPDELDRHLAELSAAELGIHPVTALRLEKERFAGDDYQAHRDYLHPHVGLIREADQTCPGMSEAGLLLREHVASGGKVALFSDYDVDGTASMEIMRLALREAGARDSQVSCGWASARDGFGLTDDFVREAAASGSKLLVVMDCGSTQSEQVALAQSLGMKVIVCDHHQLDPDNPADFHLNPHLASQLREQQAMKLLAQGRKMLKGGIEIKQRALAAPEDQDAQAELAKQSKSAHALIRKLDGLSGADVASSKLKVAIDRMSAVLDEQQGAEPSTGATLTWKLGAEVAGGRSEHWQAQPMYLAALGAMADMADMRNPENRALARVALQLHGQKAIPAGVKALAAHFEEDPANPAALIRTRAALNLPKRTVRVEAELVGRLLGAKTAKQADGIAAELMTAYEQATKVRDVMQSEAEADWTKRSRAAGAEQPFFASAIISGHAEDVGQAGVIAGRLAKQLQKPAVVFTERSVSKDGEDIYKFSVRNGVVRHAKIGRLLSDKQLQKACVVPSADGGASSNLGGHSDVVSGACTESNIELVMERLEKFAAGVDARQGFSPRRSSAVWVTARLVDAGQLPQLEREAKLVSPATNGNYPTRVSVAMRALKVGELDEQRGTCLALIELEDGSNREVQVAAQSANLLSKGAWLEAAVSLGEQQWWLRDMRPIT